MGDDIAHILQSWPYEREGAVREVTGDDGKTKLQVRLPLGIEQYDVDGRPDGERPKGFSSFLDHHEHLLKLYREENGSEEGFSLHHDDFVELNDEGMLYYYRYVLFFQVGDYARTVRDTQRNIRLFDFCRSYAAEETDRLSLEQYRPYIIRMNRVARALLSVNDGNFKRAISEIDNAVDQISRLDDIKITTFEVERKRSLSILKQMRKELEAKRPKTTAEKLEKQLADAVRAENYERAAALRDELRRIGSAARER